MVCQTASQWQAALDRGGRGYLVSSPKEVLMLYDSSVELQQPVQLFVEQVYMINHH